jgi:hypothetical protein
MRVSNPPPTTCDTTQQLLSWPYLQTFYLELRSSSCGGISGSLPITARQLESLVRLAEARARLELREMVTADDAQVWCSRGGGNESGVRPRLPGSQASCWRRHANAAALPLNQTATPQTVHTHNHTQPHTLSLCHQDVIEIMREGMFDRAPLSGLAGGVPFMDFRKAPGSRGGKASEAARFMAALRAAGQQQNQDVFPTAELQVWVAGMWLACVVASAAIWSCDMS